MSLCNVCIQSVQRIIRMARLAVKDSERLSLRVSSEDKSLLMRAVAYSRTNLTEFMMNQSLNAAKAIVEQAERIALSTRDSLIVLDALENPPKPNAKLLAAARALHKS